jgi:hypothetical protein
MWIVAAQAEINCGVFATLHWQDVTALSSFAFDHLNATQHGRVLCFGQRFRARHTLTIN